jgi:hypothetical protein
MSRAANQGIPEALVEWCRVYGEVGGRGSGDGSDARFVRAMRFALANPGTNRSTARALLACDALLTDECGGAASDPDPDRRLSGVLAELRALEGG